MPVDGGEGAGDAEHASDAGEGAVAAGGALWERGELLFDGEVDGEGDGEADGGRGGSVDALEGAGAAAAAESVEVAFRRAGAWPPAARLTWGGGLGGFSPRSARGGVCECGGSHKCTVGGRGGRCEGRVALRPVHDARHQAIHTQALDFLQNRGDLTQETRSKVAVTTFGRLLDDPDVRAKLGVEWSKGTLGLLADDAKVARALSHVVNDIASGKIKVSDVYTKQDRIDYTNGLPARVLVRPTIPAGQGTPATATPSLPPRRGRGRPAKPRDRLIPHDCVLTIQNQRLRDIERELRSLSLDGSPNAVSVLFRVFMELSADTYITSYALAVSGGADARLGTKITAVTNHLVGRNMLTKETAAPARRVAQAGSWLGPSLTTMHQWIHNPHMVPAPSDLRSYWDSLQPWFVATWSA